MLGALARFDLDSADPWRSAGIRGRATAQGLVAIVGEAPLAGEFVALGIAGSWLVHADRGEEVNLEFLIAVSPAPTFVMATKTASRASSPLELARHINS